MRKLPSALVQRYVKDIYEALPLFIKLFLFEFKMRLPIEALSRGKKAIQKKRLIHIRSPYGALICPEDALDTVKEIYGREVYTCVRPLKHDDVVVDVGAHVGIFTLKAAREAEDGLIVAVEPDPGNFRLLVRNIRANGLENVIPIRAALWKEEGTLRLFMACLLYTSPSPRDRG